MIGDHAGRGDINISHRVKIRHKLVAVSPAQCVFLPQSKNKLDHLTFSLRNQLPKTHLLSFK